MSSESILTVITPSEKVSGEISIPGSKSYTNRALVMSALAGGKCEMIGVSLSDDSNALCAALSQLGVSSELVGDVLRVQGCAGSFKPFRGEINVGPAGTTYRFLCSICAAIAGSETVLSGSARMHQRPIKDLVDALHCLGATIEYLGTTGCPPLKIRGGSLQGGVVEVNGSISSQFISSLLLAAPLFKKGLTIRVQGQQISKTYIDMTIDSMKSFGVHVENNNYQSYAVAPGQSYRAMRYRVEGDGSGASYFWGLAAVSNGKVRVKNVKHNSAQGDILFPKLLERMGCKITYGIEDDVEWIEVQGSQTLKPIDADMTLLPDCAQTLAVVAACAPGESLITGLSTLKVKETDRILAVQTELKKMGIHSEAGPDYIRVFGGKPQAAQIATYEDHRMAMSFALLGSIVPNLKIENPEVVNKSFPQYWDFLKSLGIDSVRL